MSKAMANKRVSNIIGDEEEQFEELRRGPWTNEEDTLLSNYITFNGEGHWNLLAKSSGLKRTGKSCRLRWLNYLKPDIKRGNLTPKEQILILELHSRWGNRWSRIAQHLPGRTDNEIKNYWRTRVQKQARQLKVDSNSKKFLEALRRFWMPRLREKIEQNSPSSSSSFSSSTSTNETQDSFALSPLAKQSPMALSSPQPSKLVNNFNNPSSSICSSDSMSMPKLFENSEQPNTAYYNSTPNECYHVDISSLDEEGFSQVDMSAVGPDEISVSDCQVAEIDWTNGDAAGNFWDLDEFWEISK